MLAGITEGVEQKQNVSCTFCTNHGDGASSARGLGNGRGACGGRVPCGRCGARRRVPAVRPCIGGGSAWQHTMVGVFSCRFFEMPDLGSHNAYLTTTLLTGKQRPASPHFMPFTRCHCPNSRAPFAAKATRAIALREQRCVRSNFAHRHGGTVE